MDSRIATAARVAEIAPFHVMEVQTAARALEAAGLEPDDVASAAV